MIEYRIDADAGLIWVRMSGSNTCEDLEQYIARVYRDPGYRESFTSIFEVDDDAGGPILGELPKVRLALELASQSPGALKRWAIVIPSGFKRAVAEFLLKDVRLKPLEMRFFSDRESALDWLSVKPVCAGFSV